MTRTMEANVETTLATLDWLKAEIKEQIAVAADEGDILVCDLGHTKIAEIEATQKHLDDLRKEQVD